MIILTLLYLYTFCRLPDSHSSERKKDLKNEKKKRKEENKPKKTTLTADEVARKLVTFDCACKKNCLLRVDPDSNWEGSRKLLQEYVTPWLNMTGREHREKFFSLLEGCSKGLTEGGHLEKM
jgi:hypothetical protein